MVINDLAMEYLNSNQKVALDLIIEASQLADSLNYKEGLFWATVNRGNSFWMAGMYDAALNTYFRAAHMTDNKMIFPKLAVYNNIGEVFKRKSQFDSALVYLELAKDLATDQDLQSEEVLLLYNVSELYLKTNNLKLAENYIEQSVSKISSSTNPRYEAYAWYGKGEVAERKGNIEAAINFHQKSYEIRKENKNISGQINSLNKLATILMNQGEMDRADQLIIESTKLAEFTENKNFLSQTFLVKANYMMAIGNHQEANNWLLQHYSMKDSVEQADFADQVERIKVALNAEIKEKNFELLEEKQLLQNEVIKRQTWIIISVSILAVVLLIFFMNYRRSLRHQKEQSDSLNDLNKIILTKNQKIEQINAALDHKLIHATKLLYESQKITKIDSWEYNLETGGVQWTGDRFEELGMAKELETPVNPLIMGYILKQSYERVVSILKSSSKEGLIFEEDVKIDSDDGCQRFFRFRYFMDRSEGQSIRAYGSSQEITDLVKAEEHEKAIIRSLFNLSRSANLSLVTYDFEQFVERLLKEATETMDVAGALFWIYDEPAGQLKCLKSFGVSSIEPGVELSMKSYPKYFQRLLDFRSTPVSDLLEDEKTALVNAYFYQSHGVRSLLDSKVELESELVGVFTVVHDQPKSWTYSEQRYVGSLTDIITTAYSTSLKKRLEQEKGDLIKKLLKRNENLEELTYVISHHLRGPLTRIIGLSNLYEDPQSQGIEQEIISRINQSSLELDQVIKDLIEIIKYSDEETLQDEIALRALAEETLQEVGKEWPSITSSAKMSIDPEIKVYGNTSQVKNILYALISNAFKFRRMDRNLEIRMDARRASGMIQLSIADNGRGIDLSKFESKIFKMYQRFHTDIPGTGIGLFIVKSLIESMGGQINVSSLPMDGTVFTLALPDHAPMSISKMNLTDVA
ncbi:MAG: tetratricopeptide repeat-containing sensor histidine kinase [Cytophagales bacterium]|nr:tetratricopeptide repeat-containing sensor histidine kinase [Cytophagales bacterium]